MTEIHQRKWVLQVYSSVIRDQFIKDCINNYGVSMHVTTIQLLPDFHDLVIYI